MLHFLALTREQQEEAVRRLWRDGASLLGIAAASRWSVEQIVSVLAKPEPAP
jgi:hypothetical protein